MKDSGRGEKDLKEEKAVKERLVQVISVSRKVPLRATVNICWTFGYDGELCAARELPQATVIERVSLLVVIRPMGADVLRDQKRSSNSSWTFAGPTLYS